MCACVFVCLRGCVRTFKFTIPHSYSQSPSVHSLNFSQRDQVSKCLYVTDSGLHIMKMPKTLLKGYVCKIVLFSQRVYIISRLV